MALLHDLPRWLVGIAIVGVFVSGALLGLAATRRWSRRRGVHALIDNGVTGWIFSAILGIYAIAIGLIAIDSWGNATAAAGVASHEAAEIAALFRDVSEFPEPFRGQLRAGVEQYTRYVIDEAWPLQRRGEIPHGGTETLNEFQHRLYAFEAGSEAQKAMHAEALHAYNTLIEFRRQRLEAVTYAVPATLWSVVLVGAVLSIAASYVFSIESFMVHATMTSLLAAMISLLVFFIVITDLPYRGSAGVGPDSYEIVLNDLVASRSGR
jgi:hypothetical protein